jgi:hypothetical protein
LYNIVEAEEEVEEEEEESRRILTIFSKVALT